jgi:hypothetical protein
MRIIEPWWPTATRGAGQLVVKAPNQALDLLLFAIQTLAAGIFIAGAVVSIATLVGTSVRSFWLNRDRESEEPFIEHGLKAWMLVYATTACLVGTFFSWSAYQANHENLLWPAVGVSMFGLGLMRFVPEAFEHLLQNRRTPAPVVSDRRVDKLKVMMMDPTTGPLLIKLIDDIIRGLPLVRAEVVELMHRIKGPEGVMWVEELRKFLARDLCWEEPEAAKLTQLLNGPRRNAIRIEFEKFAEQKPCWPTPVDPMVTEFAELLNSERGERYRKEFPAFAAGQPAFAPKRHPEVIRLERTFEGLKRREQKLVAKQLRRFNSRKTCWSPQHPALLAELAGVLAARSGHDPKELTQAFAQLLAEERKRPKKVESNTVIRFPLQQERKSRVLTPVGAR